MKIERSQAFVPVVYSSDPTVFSFPRERWCPRVIEDAILSFDDSLDRSLVQTHVDLLERRRQGTLTFARRWNAETLGILDIREQWKFPIYSTEVCSGRSPRWTVDVFNPRNEECRLPLYDPEREYLALLVPSVDLPKLGRDSLQELVDCHEALNARFVRIYELLGADFAFGSFGGQLAWLCNSYHLGKRKWPEGLRFCDFFWQWAIYPPDEALQKKVRRLASLRDFSSDERIPIGIRNDCLPSMDPEGMRFQELPGGALLAWTLTWELDVHEYYAKASRLKDPVAVSLKNIPD